MKNQREGEAKRGRKGNDKEGKQNKERNWHILPLQRDAVWQNGNWCEGFRV